MKTSTILVMAAAASLTLGGAGAPVPPDEGLCFATIIVVNRSGEPIVEAPVRLNPLEDGAAVVYTGITGKDGSVVFSIPAGVYLAASWKNKSAAYEKFHVVFDHHPVVTLFLDPDAP